MVDNIRAMVERRLEERRRESVIDNEKRSRPLCDLACSGEIRDAHKWIGWRLDEDRACVRRTCVRDTLRISRVDEGEAQAIAPENLVEQTESSTVYILAADDVIARLEQLHDRIETTHSTGESETVNAALQRRHVSLERLTRGILSPSVLISLVLAECFLDVSGGGVDRGHDRTGEKVRPLAGVNCAGCEPGAHVFVEDAS